MMKTTKKIILCLTIVLFVLSLSSVLFAEGWQDYKGVILRDGTIIPGKVIEANVNKVIIETKDRSRVSVKFDDVAGFLKEEYPEIYQRQKESTSP
jgi:c-di-GMP-binding flagellar brake protein YcgR